MIIIYEHMNLLHNKYIHLQLKIMCYKNPCNFFLNKIISQTTKSISVKNRHNISSPTQFSHRDRGHNLTDQTSKRMTMYACSVDREKRSRYLSSWKNQLFIHKLINNQCFITIYARCIRER